MKNQDTLLTGAQNEPKKRDDHVAKKLRWALGERWQVPQSLFNACYSDGSLKEELEPKYIIQL